MLRLVLSLCFSMALFACGEAVVPIGDGGPPDDERTDSSEPPVPREPGVHRSRATACNASAGAAAQDAGPPPIDCQTDADCVAGKSGRCDSVSKEGGVCTYDDCQSDADCGTGVCRCAGDGNRCLGQGDCQLDADCGTNGYCSPTLGSCGDYGGIVGYYCHTDEDECTDDGDCTAEGNQPYCAFNPTVGRWACSDSQCVG